MDQLAARHARWEFFSIIGLTALAAVLRFAFLGSLPPGLYHDEAYNGLDALRVLGGEHPVFFEANNGREPLFIYLCALSVGLLGRTPGALRLVSAVLGTLTVPATYGMARTLLGRHRPALWAAFLTAVSVWPLNLSRIAFRAVSLPLVSSLMLMCLWRGLEHRRTGWMAAAGALCGVALYTYLAARLIPLVILLYALVVLWREGRRFWWVGWALFSLAAGLVALPIVSYWLGHWETTLARAGQVSIWNPAIGGPNPWRTLVLNAGRVVLGFVWRGDFIPRHNVPLRPVFDPLMGAAFIAGLGLAMRRVCRHRAWGLCLIWLGVLLMPTLLAEDAPHFIRASGILPVVFVFPAAGLEALWDWLSPKWPEAALGALVGGILVASGASGLAAYWRHVHSEAAYYQFETGAVTLAREMNAVLGRGWVGGLREPSNDVAGATRQVLIAHRLWENWPNVRFLVRQGEGLGVLTAEGQIPSEAHLGSDVTLFLWPFEDRLAPLRALPGEVFITVREGAYERGDLEPESRLLYVVIRGQALSLASDEAKGVPLARWQEGISLVYYAYEVKPEGTLSLRLIWRAENAPNGSWTIFRHVVCGGNLVGQKDGPPAQGYYPTELWRARDVIEDVADVPLSEPFAPERCEIRVGWYHWPSGERLVLQEASLPMRDEATVLLR